MLVITWPDRGRKVSYGCNIFRGFDKFIGTLWGIDSGETISSYVGRTQYESRLYRAIDWCAWVLLGEHDHCLNSIDFQYVTDEMNKNATR